MRLAREKNKYKKCMQIDILKLNLRMEDTLRTWPNYPLQTGVLSTQGQVNRAKQLGGPSQTVRFR
jgi:hypothetical protein